MVGMYRKWIVVRESDGKQGFPLICVSHSDDMVGISNQHLLDFHKDYSWLENRGELGMTLTFRNFLCVTFKDQVRGYCGNPGGLPGGRVKEAREALHPAGKPG